jgi:DNA segregation ATPase FtsK/SpoIIIE-like protein
MSLPPITDDELLAAAKSVINSKDANFPVLQGKLGIGIAKAIQLLDELEKYGIISEERTETKREVIAFTPEEAVRYIMATRNIKDGKELYEKMASAGSPHRK